VAGRGQAPRPARSPGPALVGLALPVEMPELDLPTPATRREVGVNRVHADRLAPGLPGADPREGLVEVGLAEERANERQSYFHAQHETRTVYSTSKTTRNLYLARHVVFFWTGEAPAAIVSVSRRTPRRAPETTTMTTATQTTITDRDDLITAAAEHLDATSYARGLCAPHTADPAPKPQVRWDYNAGGSYTLSDGSATLTREADGRWTLAMESGKRFRLGKRATFGIAEALVLRERGR